MSEVWKPVTGYEGLYEVSDLGRVRSLDRVVTGKDGRDERHNGKILRSQKLYNGYLEVHVSKNGKRKHRTIHSLVAEAFLGPRPRGRDVMHVDGDRANNALENLRYGTRSENLRSTYAYGGKQANGKLSLEDVTDIRKRLTANEPVLSIAERYGVNSAAVYHIKNGTAFSWHREEGDVCRL